MRKAFLVVLLEILLFNVLPNRALANEDQLVRDKLCSWVENGTKQKDLAAILGVDPSTISRFLDGTIKHSPKILRNFKIKYHQEYQALTTPIHPQMRPVKRVTIDPYQKPKVVRKLNMETKILPPQNQLTPVLPLNSESPPTLAKENPRQNLQKIEVTVPTLTYRPSVIRERVKGMHVQAPIVQKAPVVISYRDEGSGKGAFYDHYTIQRAINYPTLISHAPETIPSAIKSYVKTITQNLPLGVSVDGRNIPEVIPDSFEGGLLVIPGRTRDNEYDPIRTPYEKRIIKEALKRGQPIFSICAGSWQLWEAFGGRTKDVTDHCYRGGMMRVGVNGNIVCNKQIHRISIEEDSLLSKAMGKGPHGQPTVNSLHWKAPDERTIPQFLRVAARAVRDDNIAPLSSTGSKQPMAVESNTIEAFESEYGAPILGIQWHPEAYNSNDDQEMSPGKHINVIKYMAHSGHAYKMRRQMLREFEEVIR